MLSAMRDKAGGIFAKILLGLLVVSFAIWGIEDIFRHGGQTTVAKVAGKTISAVEFRQALDRELEGFRRILGPKFSDELIKSMGIPQQVLERMIYRMLLQKEAERLHINLDDKAVFTLIKNNPVFRNDTGSFDKQLFEQAVQNMNMSEADFVNEMRKDEIARLVTETLLSGLVIPPALLSAMVDATGQQRTADLMLFLPSPSLVKDAPTDEELITYQREHAQAFTVPEYRTLSYVILSPKTLSSNISVTEDEIRRAYEEKLPQISLPEKREVEQLLFKNSEEAHSAYEEIKSGASFARIMKKYQILNGNATKLGQLTRNEVPENAGDTVFNLKANGYSEPYQSSFGWHIFHVTAIEPAKVPALAELKSSLEKQVAQKKAETALFDSANKMEDALAGGTALEEAAKDAKLPIVRLGPIDNSGKDAEGKKPENFPSYPNFLDISFGLSQGEVSSLTNGQAAEYFIVRADKVQPAKIRALGEVKPQVAAAWKKEQADLIIERQAREAEKALAGGASATNVVSQHGGTIVTIGLIERNADTAAGYKLTREMLDDIFSLAPAQPGKLHLMPGGGYAIPILKSVSPVTHAANATHVAEMKKALTQNYINELFTQYMHYLEGKYSVRINHDALESASSR